MIELSEKLKEFVLSELRDIKSLLSALEAFNQCESATPKKADKLNRLCKIVSDVDDLITLISDPEFDNDLEYVKDQVGKIKNKFNEYCEISSNVIGDN